MSKLKTIIIATMLTIFTASLILHPQESLSASVRGLTMWWEVVFPSLLPFFILSDLLINFGVVSFIGVLLEPLMRPLFRVPGVGGFVWAMGMASGFPSGAKLSARLREEKQLTRIEAERLVSFTNSSNPLFIFGAIAVGFFHNANLGLLLAFSHYSSNFLVGLIMRFHGKGQQSYQSQQGISIKKAFTAMHEKRVAETRPLGKMIGDAIASSIQTLLMIGGFIILFSVCSSILAVTNTTALLAPIIQYVLQLFQLPATLSLPMLSGILEITLGNQLTSQSQAPLFTKAVGASFILAFSGLSVQAQVASILAETDIRFFPYFVARCIQSMIAPMMTWILWKPLYENYTPAHPQNATPVFAQSLTPFQFFHIYGPILTLFCLYVYLVLLWRKNKTP